MLRRIRRSAIGAALALTAGAAVVAAPQETVATLPSASAAITCDTSGGGTKFYPGDDSSRTYNTTFARATSIDHYLSSYVPQGLGMWENWNGGTEDLFLIGMHHEDENNHASLVYGVTPGGTVRGAAYLPKGAHVGGLKTYKGWLYVQQNTSELRRYSLATVRSSFKSAGIQSLGGGTPLKVTGVSFFDIYDGKLYGGLFDEDSRNVMRRWSITSTGALTADAWGPLQVPTKTQGLLVQKDTYVFSTSSGRNNRSNIYVVRRGYTKSQSIESVRYRCFRAPVLSQELVDYAGRAYLSFEGGADYFDGTFPWTTADNRIKNLHSASTATLRSFVW